MRDRGAAIAALPLVGLSTGVAAMTIGPASQLASRDGGDDNRRDLLSLRPERAAC